jgi:hypothetical protein
VDPNLFSALLVVSNLQEAAKATKGKRNEVYNFTPLILFITI